MPFYGLDLLIVGVLLIVFEPRNRHARFGLPAIDGLALFLGLAALARQLLELLRQSCGFVACLLQPRLVGDDGFFLFVMLGGQRVDRGQGLRDGRIERGRFLPILREIAWIASFAPARASS